jgi:hypothetical protein
MLAMNRLRSFHGVPRKIRPDDDRQKFVLSTKRVRENSRFPAANPQISTKPDQIQPCCLQEHPRSGCPGSIPLIKTPLSNPIYSLPAH